MNILSLTPATVWKFFHEICQIPHPSKQEARLAEYIIGFAKSRNLQWKQDDTGNVLISKAATPGKEKTPIVILQSHLDMVCEKNEDTVFDFQKDPIHPYIDGVWVKARGTTLGADDGIGIAIQLALLDATDIPHGPIECLFTVDEETGLTGAFGLKPGFLEGRILINLDSEDEGRIFIGCAGGRDTVAYLPYSSEPTPRSMLGYKVTIKGLKGGHSGDDINKGLGNATKILNRLLWNASRDFQVRISMIDAGNLRNAIAREATATIAINLQNEKAFTEYIAQFDQDIKNELRVTEPDVKIAAEKVSAPATLIDGATQEKLLHAVYACPHGVIEMSREIPNFVETSTNLASVKTGDKEIVITTSQRSSVESAKKDVVDMVESVFQLIGARVEHSAGYPGWKPNPDSPLLKQTVDTYRQLFQAEPKVLAVHAGLECGLIGATYPGMDMISIGPTMRGVHSPDEKIEITSVEKCWDLIVALLDKIGS